ncbi:MAG: hypothetical protein LCH93_06670 [Proteobacteria bacterium]|nr:hypothetical protein [Pseudomonadota bacterium]
MSKPDTGGCACGAVRYEIPGEPLAMADRQCRDCQRKSGTGHGSYLTSAAMPDFFTIHAASLDDPGRYQPRMVFYTVSGHAWDKLDPALPKFDRLPSKLDLG